MSKKTTKRALAMSFVSVFLCVCMLVGTTFAWFTDEASTKINTIQAGNLDIVVSYALQKDVVNGDIPDSAWKVLDENDPVFDPNALWEPGYTEVVYFKIKNNGSLALKYTMSTKIADETPGTNKAGKEFKLSEYLTAYQMTADTKTIYPTRENAQDPFGGFAAMFPELAPVTLAEAANMETGKAKSLSYELSLEPDAIAYTTMVVFMPTTVGNEANHNGDQPTIKLGINVAATQYTYEDDSYDDQYDKDAEYPVIVSSDADLTAAISAGAKEITLTAGTYTFPASSLSEEQTLICAPGTVFEGAKLNANGATVVGATFSGTASSNTVNGIYKDCTFTGSNGLRYGYVGETAVFENCVFSGNTYGIHFDGGANEVIFKNCTISGFNATAAAVTKVTFEGCTFVGNGKSSYNGINLWGNGDFKNCTFVFDGSSAYEWIDLCSGGKTANFENCVVNDGITTSNVSTLIGDKLTKREASGKIIVDGVELTY